MRGKTIILQLFSPRLFNKVVAPAIGVARCPGPNAPEKVRKVLLNRLDLRMRILGKSILPAGTREASAETAFMMVQPACKACVITAIFQLYLVVLTFAHETPIQADRVVLCTSSPFSLSTSQPYNTISHEEICPVAKLCRSPTN